VVNYFAQDAKSKFIAQGTAGTVWHETLREIAHLAANHSRRNMHNKYIAQCHVRGLVDP
jgi:hypothetical protein